jgi:N-acetylmuramoyl-L-alanine amidase
LANHDAGGTRSPRGAAVKRFARGIGALALLLCCGALHACGPTRDEAVVLAPEPAPDVPAPEPEPAPAPDSAPAPAGSMEALIASLSRESSSQASLHEIALLGRGVTAQPGAPLAELRAVLRFDGTPTFQRGELPAQEGMPRRVYVDLDEVGVAAAVPSLIRVGQSGLQRVRVVSLGAARVRVSFDVEDAASYQLYFLPDPFRLILDFRLPSIRGAAAGRASATIVIDPGHGGAATGAKAPDGLRESDVALALARRVRRSLLRELPSARVVLTRDADVDLSLEERAAIANALSADVFVSIHLNASSSADDKGGVSTFVLDTSDDEAALRLAARENGTRVESVSQLQKIIATLYREDQVEQSLQLARSVHELTLLGGRSVLPALGDRGVKRALFYVLVGATMPSILVEASFITRPEEAVALRSDGYRQVLADGIASGILRYVRARREQQARDRAPH